MKINIASTEQFNEDTVIRFESSIGSGMARWSSRTEPTVGSEYDVEFDIDAFIEKNRTGFPTRVHDFFIKAEEGVLELNGVAESIDEDGMVYFRLAIDCLIMIESEVGKVDVGEWMNLKFDLKDVQVFAQGM